MQKNLRDLKEMRDGDGQPFKIVEIPMPDPVIYEDQRLPRVTPISTSEILL